MLGVLAAVMHGATLVILEGFSLLLVLSAVEEEKCTALYGVPIMFIVVLEHRTFARYDLSSLRTGIMAGSPCPVPVMEKVMDAMHMQEVTICYGLTEASPVMTQTRVHDSLAQRT